MFTMDFLSLLCFYLVPLGLIWAFYLGLRIRRQRSNLLLAEEAREAGLSEPPSLHPVINPNRCIGCGSCVSSCPEQEGHAVLGIIDGKSHLIGPTNCIGHGACKTACPMDAVTLVLGTASRGVEIPVLGPDFQTAVPGVFVAGELGGMGLIRNAIEQGRQALESLAVRGCSTDPDVLDVLIVGAGPAGFAATLGAKEKGLYYLCVEQESLGGTVYHYPRGKIVMTSPATLPIEGPVKFTETTKEELLAFWSDVEVRHQVQINYGERVDQVEKVGDLFCVRTNKKNYQARSVLLAIGRRGTPRKLEVSGEEQSKVVYSLIDPEQYRGRKVLVVGGGDSALEAALALADEPGTRVTLSYRGEAFGRAKAKNRALVEEAAQKNSIDLRLGSEVKAIEKKRVLMQWKGSSAELENDIVIVCAGGILPTAFLQDIGISVETKYGTP